MVVHRRLTRSKTIAPPFGKPDVREWRVRKHHIRDKPISDFAIPASNIVPDDPEIVDRDMGELRTAGARDRHLAVCNERGKIRQGKVAAGDRTTALVTFKAATRSPTTHF